MDTINDYNAIDDYTTINDNYITIDSISKYSRWYDLEHHVNYDGLEIYNYFTNDEYVDNDNLTSSQYFNIMEFLSFFMK